MEINFYLNNEEQTDITQMRDMVSNPFNLNDIIHLNVEDMSRNRLEAYPKQMHDIFKEEQKVLWETFRLKDVKLVKECKFLKFSRIGETKLIIEYYCEIV